MSLIIIIAALLLILIVLITAYPLRVAGSFNSEVQPDIYIMMSWLNPLLNGFIANYNKELFLIIYLFNKKIFIKEMKHIKNFNQLHRYNNILEYINFARFVKLNKTKLYASYGFVNPAATGILCGAINLFSQLVTVDKGYNNADFLTDSDYINISIEADINIIVSLIRMFKAKLLHLNMQISHAGR